MHKLKCNCVGNVFAYFDDFLRFFFLIYYNKKFYIVEIHQFIILDFYHWLLLRVFLGDRDWNQSHVYRMINETRTDQRQVYQPGQQSQPITTKTVQTTQKTYSYDYQPTMEDGYGVSEF